MSRKKSGRTIRPSTPVPIVDEIPYVSVYCDGISVGDHEKWLIASFLPDVKNGSLVWHPDPVGYRDPKTARITPIARDVVQWLDGDAWVSKAPMAHDPYLFYKESFRVRWTLRCATCGLSRAAKSPELFYAPFATMANLNIKEVRLAHLVHASSDS